MLVSYLDKEYNNSHAIRLAQGIFQAGIEGCVPMNQVQLEVQEKR